MAIAVLLPGCVERRIYIRSEPVGAEVYIDGEYVGRTRAEDHVDGPLYANFVFYGTRDYTLRKPGYQTTSGVVVLEAPWYEYPPFDFFAEVLVPYPIVDEHHIGVKMEKAQPADVDALYARARDYRYNARPEDRYEYDFLWDSWKVKPRQD